MPSRLSVAKYRRNIAVKLSPEIGNLSPCRTPVVAIFGRCFNSLVFHDLRPRSSLSSSIFIGIQLILFSLKTKIVRSISFLLARGQCSASLTLLTIAELLFIFVLSKHRVKASLTSDVYWRPARIPVLILSLKWLSFFFFLSIFLSYSQTDGGNEGRMSRAFVGVVVVVVVVSPEK